MLGLGFVLLALFAAGAEAQFPSNYIHHHRMNIVSQEEIRKCPVALKFDLPVGKKADANGRRPLAWVKKTYYNANKFLKKTSYGLHLGEDWNGKGGGNTDLGDPIFSIADGVVTESFDLDAAAGNHRDKAWGNIIRVLYKYPTQDKQFKYIEALYAHMERRLVNEGDIVKRGQKIGTIGGAEGTYLAHLHFELRSKINVEYRSGYTNAADRDRVIAKYGYMDPTKFIGAHANIPRSYVPSEGAAPPQTNTNSNGGNQNPPPRVPPPAPTRDQDLSPREYYLKTESYRTGITDRQELLRRACRIDHYPGVAFVQVDVEPGMVARVYKGYSKGLALRIAACRKLSKRDAQILFDKISATGF